MAKKWQFRRVGTEGALGDWIDVTTGGPQYMTGWVEFREVEAPPEPKYEKGDTFKEGAWTDPTTYEVVSDPLMGEGGDYGKYYYHLKVSNGESIWYDTFRETMLDTITKTN